MLQHYIFNRAASAAFAGETAKAAWMCARFKKVHMKITKKRGAHNAFMSLEEFDLVALHLQRAH